MHFAEICGRKWPMEYTVGVLQQVQQRFGGIRAVMDTYKDKTAEESITMTCELAAMMIAGHKSREAVRARIVGEDAPELETITADEIKSVMLAGDAKALTSEVMGALSDGMKGTIEAEPVKKNGDGTSQ